MADNPYIIQEDQVPSSWKEVKAEPIVPGAGSPSAPAPAVGSLPPYFRGSFSENMEHDAQFVATDRNARIASTPIIPPAPSANPQINSAIKSVVSESVTKSTVTSTGMNFRGTWMSFINYNVSDVVLFNISAYVAILANNNAEPDENSTLWTLLSKNLNFRGVWT